MIFNVKDNIIKENIFSIINMSSCHPQSENDHLKTNDFEIIFFKSENILSLFFILLNNFSREVSDF